MFFQRNRREIQAPKNRRMSIEKPLREVSQQVQLQQPTFTRSALNQRKQEGGLGGVSSTVTTGDATNQCLFQINLSNYPGVKKVFVSFKGVNCNLTDFPSSSFPQIMFLELQGVSNGLKRIDGQGTHAVQALKVSSPPTFATVAGIKSYSLKYCPMSDQDYFQVTGIPVLTFNVSEGAQMIRPTSYPISEPINGVIQLTYVTY